MPHEFATAHKFSPCRLAERLFLAASVSVAFGAAVVSAQTSSQPARPSAVQATPQDAASAPTAPQESKATKPTRTADRRRAVRQYLAATKLFEKEKFEEAMDGYQRAADLDPSNPDYPLAASLARGHAATIQVQLAAKARIHGDEAGARAAVAHALELDPKNLQAAGHLNELADDSLRSQVKTIYGGGSEDLGEQIELAPSAGVHSFHLRAEQRQMIKQIFKAYGIDAVVDESIRSVQVKLDVDDATFEQAAGAVGLLTNSFYVPLDAHRALAAKNTSENRQHLSRSAVETVYLTGLTTAEMTDVANLAKNIFGAEKTATEQSAGTITLHAHPNALRAFNSTMSQLLDGRSQVMLEVRMFQLAHTHERNTGVQPPQSVSAYNVYAEEQSLLNANQALVQQIISSGLAAPGDTLAILGILLASGKVSSSLFSSGIALFGGGLTLSALSPGSYKANLSLNSSDSRELDQIQLRLGDGEAGTLRTGMRYPIQTSSYSNGSISGVNIPGLTSAGSSGALSSLLSSLGGGGVQIPQVEYQDLGLTLKVTPKVMRNGDVALTLDLKVDSLAGSSINGNPVLNNRAYTAIFTLRQGEGAVVLSDLDKQESRAISGVPGISEIPGMNDITEKDVQKNYATLMIVMTPYVIRGTQAHGHSPMMRVERGQQSR